MQEDHCELYIETMSQVSKNFFNSLSLSQVNFYILRSGIQLEKPSVHTVQFRGESTVYLGAKIWELIPESIKSSESVHIFKSKMVSRNLSVPTMQVMRQSGWFCKLIIPCWRPLLPYCFKDSQ